MARLVTDGSDLVLDLSGLEAVEAFHGSIRVPLATVTAVRVASDPWSQLRGIRAHGTGVPGVIAVGTRRGSGFRDFAAVHGKGPCVVVELVGAPYDRLVATEDDADSVAAGVRHAAGLA
jgi:hypothetical protein